MRGIEKIFDGAIDEYVSTPALCECLARFLVKTENCGMHSKAAGHVWAITAKYERDLVAKSIKRCGCAGPIPIVVV